MDQETFNKLVLPKQNRMFRLAKNMLGSAVEAEDLLQDLYEKLWRRRDTLGLCDDPGAFIFAVLRNLCIDRLRSRNIRRDRNERFRSVADFEQQGVAPTEMNDLKRIAVQLIAELPEKQRLVIHLRDVEGCDLAEIASWMEMDETAVRMNLSRARKTIRERMIKIMNHGIR